MQIPRRHQPYLLDTSECWSLKLGLPTRDCYTNLDDRHGLFASKVLGNLPMANNERYSYEFHMIHESYCGEFLWQIE